MGRSAIEEEYMFLDLARSWSIRYAEILSYEYYHASVLSALIYLTINLTEETKYNFVSQDILNDSWQHSTK